MNRSPKNIDPRILYAALIVAVALPFFLPWRPRLTVSPATHKLFDTVEALPPDSFVLLGLDWSAGTRGENGSQTEALIRHLMKRKLRFAILSFDPQGPTLGQGIAKRLEAEYGVREGVNWVNLGYKVDQTSYLKSFVNDVVRAAPTDIHGAAAGSLPAMHGVRTAKDIAMVIDVTPSTTYQVYIQFVTVPFNIPLGLAPTAVMAPEAFNYLDSGQISGLVNGLNGAAEYEQQLDVVGRATRASNSLSFAHLLIILLIVIGNVAMVVQRRRGAAQ